MASPFFWYAPKVSGGGGGAPSSVFVVAPSSLSQPSPLGPDAAWSLPGQQPCRVALQPPRFRTLGASQPSPLGPDAAWSLPGQQPWRVALQPPRFRTLGDSQPSPLGPDAAWSLPGQQPYAVVPHSVGGAVIATCAKTAMPV